MSSIKRQNALYVSESWERIYEALSNVNFKAYDQSSLRNAIQDYVRQNYPDEFQDWIGSDEFIIRSDIIAWLAQSISYRTDMNTRENFISVAERRDSLLRLARNVSYNVKRVTAASGEVRIEAISTTQQVFDQDGNPIRGQVIWNDPTDTTWLDKWNAVLNAAFSNRTQFGRPLRKHTSNGVTTGLYRFNSLAPATGVYPFTAATASGTASNFEVINVSLDPKTGAYTELSPDPLNAFHVLYKTDGLGTSSDNTGFFLPIKQGRKGFQDNMLENALSVRLIDIDTQNINSEDIWVTEVSEDGDLIDEWTQTNGILRENTTFNNIESDKVYEVVSRIGDRVTIRFGDGKYGKIPVGRFRTWFRTSDPSPRSIKPKDIRRKSLTIPYSDGQGNIFSLLISFSLKQTISNAAPSESNDDIKTRSPAVYYTQDRMVNAEDHNSLPLDNPSVLKVKSVNRTFSGHGLSVPHNDPTGVYQSTSSNGSDGRLYSSLTLNQETISADPSVVSIESLVANNLQPILNKQDKRTLYNNLYPEIIFRNPPSWFEDSVVNERSRGRFRRGTNTGSPFNAVLGDGAGTEELMFIRKGSYVRFTDHEGPITKINTVTSQGLVENAVHLSSKINTGYTAVSVFPVFRSTLNLTEQNEISNKLLLKRSFGMRWDQNILSWKTIDAENMDNISNFSLLNTGDNTKSSKDASWLVRFEYKQNDSANDTWTIIERGMEIVFESDREVTFYHANDVPINDPETGKRLRDHIVITKDNEHRDSFARRGLSVGFGSDQRTGELSFVGDGTTIQLDLTASDLDPKSVFLSIDGEQAPTGSWSLRRGDGNDYIILGEALAENSTALVRMDPSISKLNSTIKETQGDDVTKVYELGRTPIYSENIFFFEDGKTLAPYSDFNVVKSATTSDKLIMTSPPGNGNDVIINAWGGSGPSFSHIRYVGDGIEDSFSTFVPDGNLVMVFIDGYYQHAGYTLVTGDLNNIRVLFDTPPTLNQKIDIRTSTDKSLIRYKKTSIVLEAGQDTVVLDTETQTALNSDTIVFVDGQYTGYTIENGVVFLDVSASGGELFEAVSIIFLASIKTARQIVQNATFKAKPRTMDNDFVFFVERQLIHPDGYPNQRGIIVNPADENLDSLLDKPFAFRDLVIRDRKTDLVIWRKVERNGGTEWQSLNQNTLPRGTYQNSFYDINLNDPLDVGIVNGSVHYRDGEWLVADTTSGLWSQPDDSTIYKVEVGRGGMKFRWNHYASDARRIDPSPTNINEVFVLTRSYYNEVINWIGNGGTPPQRPTPEFLSESLSSITDKKMVSDTIIWRPARFRILFGNLADDGLTANFVVVKVPGATIPDSDLKLRILKEIDNFFVVDNWDFGESFYYSELAAYIHQQLPSLVQSVVIVPRGSNASFGRLFQVRSLDDELFISSAAAENIDIVPALTDSRLRMA